MSCLLSEVVEFCLSLKRCGFGYGSGGHGFCASVQSWSWSSDCLFEFYGLDFLVQSPNIRKHESYTLNHSLKEDGVPSLV